MPTRLPLVRSLVAEAVGRMETGEPGDRVLDRVLRRHRDLTSEERRLVAEWSFGIALWRGRIDHFATGDAALRLAVFLADREQRPIEEAARTAEVDPDRLRAALATPPPTDPVERLAFTRSLPHWLARRWIDEFGPERADALAAATNERGPVTLRTNTLKTTRETLEARLAGEGVRTRRGVRSPLALHVVGRANILSLESWRAGWFEVQDEGSQLVAEAVAARPGELVVDLCAGSGGKTLALAAALGGHGRIVAVDLDPARLRDLEVRARRAGAAGIETRAGDGRDSVLLADLAGRADAVLVDAPCSSTGVLRRGPDARWRLRREVFDELPPVQSALLAAGARLVRPGGRLVYATCSVDRAENEAVADAFRLPYFVERSRTRLAPDTHGTDGFFLASWHRVAPA